MNNPLDKIPPQLKDATTKDRNLQICLWFAELKTPQEVAELVKHNFGIEYSRQSAWQFSKGKKYSRIIRYLKRRFLAELSAIPIANKAIRLKYLQGIYKEAMTESLKSINQWGEVYELKLSAAVEAIKAAKEEIEGDKPLIDASTHYHFTKINDQGLLEELQENNIPLPDSIKTRLNSQEPVNADNPTV